jgi:hypothetical protein
MISNILFSSIFIVILSLCHLYRKFRADCFAPKAVDAVALAHRHCLPVYARALPVKHVDRAHFNAYAVTDTQIKVDCYVRAIDPEVA